ncbi:Insulin-like growth factor I [Mactra antiquata]
MIILTFSFVSKGMGSSPQYYCGRALTDLLDFVCSGRGFYFHRFETPTLDKRGASQFFGSSVKENSRKRRGIANECCENPCTRQQMESYCAVPSGEYVSNPTAGPLSLEEADSMFNGRGGGHFSGLFNSLDLPMNIPTMAPKATTTTIPPPPTTTTKIVPTTPSKKKIFEQFIKKKIQKLTNRLKANFFFVRKVGPTPTRTPKMLI